MDGFELFDVERDDCLIEERYLEDELDMLAEGIEN
jgi:hypothetical protein